MIFQKTGDIFLTNQKMRQLIIFLNILCLLITIAITKESYSGRTENVPSLINTTTNRATKNGGSTLLHIKYSSSKISADDILSSRITKSNKSVTKTDSRHQSKNNDWREVIESTAATAMTRRRSTVIPKSIGHLQFSDNCPILPTVPGQELVILVSTIKSGIYTVNESGIPVKTITARSAFFDYDPIFQQIIFTDNSVGKPPNDKRIPNLHDVESHLDDEPSPDSNLLHASLHLLFEDHTPGRFWTLKTSDIHGTNKRTIDVIDEKITGLAVDWLERKIFITGSGIKKYNLKTMEAEDELRTLYSINAIAVDVFHGVIYWEDYFRIRRSDYFGNNREDIVTSSTNVFIKFVVDYLCGTIYFSTSSSHYLATMEQIKLNQFGKRKIFSSSPWNLSAMAIQGDDLLYTEGRKLMRLNDQTGFHQIPIPEFSSLINDLKSVPIKSANYSGYEDLACPVIARCFGIDGSWTCLQESMICDRIPNCYGGLDEFHCCYGDTNVCNSIQELYFVCSRTEGNILDDKSQDFVEWKRSLFWKIFGETFFSFHCSLKLKYFNKKSFGGTIHISHIQRNTILRQLAGPTVFNNYRDTSKVSFSGHLPYLTKSAFFPFHNLVELNLHNTTSEYIGRNTPIGQENSMSSILYNYAFQGLNNLYRLTISENLYLSTIDKYTFAGLKNLHILEINKNVNLTEIKENALSAMTNLQMLNISGNTLLTTLNLSGTIPSLKKGHFYTDTINEVLVHQTSIKCISEFFFEGIETLQNLTISENTVLSAIKKNAFNGLKFLLTLKISKNLYLEIIEEGAFDGLKTLSSLTISNQNVLLPFISMGVVKGMDALLTLNIVDNGFSYLYKNLFNNVQSIKYLNISGNSLKILEDGLLDKLTYLKVIDLRKNKLRLTTEIFRNNIKLTHIYSDSYSFCCVKPPTVNDKNCYAPKDDLSSCADLIADRSLRTCLWEIGLMAFLGNISVLIHRFRKEKKSLKKSFSVFVVNLSLSDAIMGLYMLIIGFHDSLYEGEYVVHDYDWKRSDLCKVTGVLAFISSELSVMFVGIITIDRFLAVKYPIGGKQISLQQACVFSAIAWFAALLLAVIPVLIYPEFYSYSGTCLALPLTGHFQPGWQISIGVFVVSNFTIFVLVAIGQILILREIKQSARRAGNKHSSKEREAAKLLFMVALTDGLCWFPVAVMATMALAGMNIPREIYAWVIVFVLPVNSAINPFLYTFVPLCRKKQREMKAVQMQISVTDPPSIVQKKK